MKRLLLLENHRLGDAVMSLPFLRGATEAGWEVHAGSSTAARAVYETVLPPERIVTWDRSVDSFRALRRIGAEAGVSVWADVRDHLLLRLLGIPRRIGFPMNRRNYYANHLAWRQRSLRIGQALQGACRLGGLRLLTDSLQRTDYSQHHVADWGQIAAEIDFPLRLEAPWLDLPPLPLSDAAEQFLRDHAGEGSGFSTPGRSSRGSGGPITRGWCGNSSSRGVSR